MESFEETRRKEEVQVLPDFKKISAFNSLKVGVLFSGGPAAGGANVLAGLFDALQKMNPKSELIGFLGGPSGILDEKSQVLSKNEVDKVRNLGGFDLLGTGRTKIETPEQFEKAKEVITKMKLDGLVIVGGDDSNTNAYFIHEYLLKSGINCSVVGVPKTIDGDLKSKEVEISFGFDTACKVFSSLIGNICIDAMSSLKYWHFIKLMGRTASHVTLECALQTGVNIALIAEERLSLKEIVSKIADTVESRSRIGKNYGVILIPEGLIEFIPEVAKEIPAELLQDKDSHGNIKVSQIETEKLLSKMVIDELKRRGNELKLNPVHHFFGYEGRCSYPSLFDATYCYNLGINAAELIKAKKSGVMATIQNTAKDITCWKPASLDLKHALVEELRNGLKKQVIAKALVNLKGPVFEEFLKTRESNKLKDNYLRPGPIQFFGPTAPAITRTLFLEQQ